MDIFLIQLIVPRLFLTLHMRLTPKLFSKDFFQDIGNSVCKALYFSRENSTLNKNNKLNCQINYYQRTVNKFSSVLVPKI